MLVNTIGWVEGLGAELMHNLCDLLEPSIALLESNSWLAKSALIYLESDQPLEDCLLPENWTLVKNKKAGQVYYGLCQRTG